MPVSLASVSGANPVHPLIPTATFVSCAWSGAPTANGQASATPDPIRASNRMISSLTDVPLYLDGQGNGARQARFALSLGDAAGSPENTYPKLAVSFRLVAWITTNCCPSSSKYHREADQ